MIRPKFDFHSWINSSEECKNAFKYYVRQKLILTEFEGRFLTASHIKKSDYNLDFINFLIEQKKFYDWVIVGCYYAIYQAALALLSVKNYSSKKHNSTLCALIHFYYHNKKEITEEDIELISRSSLGKEEVSYFVEAKSKRETASYGISYEFTKLEAENLKDNTIKFINKVKSILESAGV